MDFGFCKDVFLKSVKNAEKSGLPVENGESFVYNSGNSAPWGK